MRTKLRLRLTRLGHGVPGWPRLHRPAGEVTMSLRAPGCLPVSTTILAEPSTVCGQGVVSFLPLLFIHGKAGDAEVWAAAQGVQHAAISGPPGAQGSIL